MQRSDEFSLASSELRETGNEKKIWNRRYDWVSNDAGVGGRKVYESREQKKSNSIARRFVLLNELSQC